MSRMRPHESTAGVPALQSFKYCNFQRAIQCLEDGTLYFARPGRLNDTLEGRFEDVAFEDFQRTIESTLSEISVRRGGPPLIVDSAVAPKWKEAFEKENRRLQEFVAKAGILSASARPDRQQLWAYYADNHRGVCFELWWPDELLQRAQIVAVQVRYEAGPRTWNRADTWRKLFLDLAERSPMSSVEELFRQSMSEPFRSRRGMHDVVGALAVKDPCWEHEEEIRLIIPEGDQPLEVLPNVLKRVYFIDPPEEFKRQGPVEADTYQRAMQRIHELLVTRYPSVEIVWGQFHHGGLRFPHQSMQTYLVPESELAGDIEGFPFLSWLPVDRRQALSPQDVLATARQPDGRRANDGPLSAPDTSSSQDRKE